MIFEQITTALREARSRKGLSQRALGDLVGLPQSHISKIESGGVDLQLSSLVELARALELDIRLIPRKAIPAVDSVVRSTTPAVGAEQQARLQDGLRRLADVIQRLAPANVIPEADRLRDALHLLRHIPVPPDDIPRVRKALEQINPLQDLASDEAMPNEFAVLFQQPKFQSSWKQAVKVLMDVRNRIAHPSVARSVRPAYVLDEEDNDA